MDQNIVVLSGRCGKDPELRRVGANSTAIATFSMATSKPPKNKGDEWPSTWHNIKCWSKLAERVDADVRKGDRVSVVGYLDVESWEGSDGEKKYKSVVVAMDVVCAPKAAPSSNVTPAPAPSTDFPEDDLPF